MAWVVVDASGEENVYDFKPIRKYDCFWVAEYGSLIPLPKGSIKKLIDRELTWENKPVELK